MVYWAGRGDVKNNFHCWSSGRIDDSITGVGYSELVFEVCTELGIPLLALSSHSNPEVARNDLIEVESVPVFFAGKSGASYYSAHTRAAMLVARRALAFNASIVAISEEISPSAVLPLRLLGMKMVQIRHCALWPRATVPSLPRRLSWHLQGQAYRLGFAAVLGVSATVTDQVRQVVANGSPPTLEFVPLWRDAFRNVPPPPESRTPFRVLVAGRLLASKGFFDVITVARELSAQGHAFEFEICGDGPDLASLQRRLAEERLTNVASHGWCSPAALLECLGRCHAVLVPTTPGFNEGFNKVVVEALLAGRPVVASDVCPSAEYVEDALLVYPGGDLVACRDSLLRLANDPALYARKRESCSRVGRPFLDKRFSLRAALRDVLTAFRDDGRVERKIVLGSPDFASAQTSHPSSPDLIAPGLS
jgi:glycosyltransferase involved in cell wall biosynthesis